MSHRSGDMLPPVVARNADRQARRRGMGTTGAGQSTMPSNAGAPVVPVPVQGDGHGTGTGWAANKIAAVGRGRPAAHPMPLRVGLTGTGTVSDTLKARHLAKKRS